MAAKNYVAQQLHLKNELTDLHKIFKQMDADGNGLLSKDELRKGLEKNEMISLTESKEVFDLFFKKIDTSDDGKVSYTEFLVAVGSRETFLTDDNIEMAFNSLKNEDTNCILVEDLNRCYSESLNERLATHN